MTDPGMADATYVGPMTPELVEQILDKVGEIQQQHMLQQQQMLQRQQQTD